MTSSIIWQNDAQTVCLLDIPRSIAAAQGTPSQAWHRHLQSSEPLQRPYPTNEPSSKAGKAGLATNSVDQTLHHVYEPILQEALGEIREHYHGSWCRPRTFVAPNPHASKKRRVDGILHIREASDGALPAHVLPDIAHGRVQAICSTVDHGQSAEESNAIHDADLEFYSSHDEQRGVSHIITISPVVPSTGVSSIDPPSPSEHHTSSRYNFHIPPNSTFSLTSCTKSRAFHTHIRNQAQEALSRKRFDLILLDPPWPNRSVKRTHKTAGSTYSTLKSVTDVHQLLVAMDLDMLMDDACLVAIWITNKPAIRDLILAPGGMFESWGVHLMEEWLWLKTTIHGEPVSPLAALWRKPYEILLIGRKHRLPRAQALSADEHPKRRVVVSVPDLHSRKPCLKELFHPLLPRDYRALEVFARHLVSGWWSWGDECLKFNWEGYWKESDGAAAG